MAAAPVASSAPALYVADLHPDVTDGHLVDFFSKEGSVASVRICRDSITGRSLGYGYVNYIATQDAFNAMGKLNYNSLIGKPIRIMWSRRDSDVRRNGIGNLFVKNLDDSIDNVKLHEMFANFGTILSCKVATTRDGKNKGFGFVQFESEESANSAIAKLNGSTIGSKQIYVANFIRKSERASNLDAKYTNLYMKNLDEDITEELLQLKFSEFGKITNLAIAKDANGNSKGFGFVNFDNPDDAKRAMETMNGVQLGSKALYVARAQKKAEREQVLRCLYEEKRNEQIRKYMASNVYVKNIDDSVTDNDLREHFSQCGSITSAKIMHDDKGISKGFGFVCFTTPEEANTAVNTLHGRMFHAKPLYVAMAQRREDRQAQLQLQFAQRMAGLGGSLNAVIPAGYPPFYYSGVVSQIPSRQGFMYQQLGVRPGWRPSGFVPQARPSFQPMPVPMIPNTPRQQRPNRGRSNGNALPQTAQTMSYMPHLQQANHSANSARDSSNHQRAGQGKYVPNGRLHELNGLMVPSPASNSHGTEMLSSMLAAASPQQQKQMLGERLFPLVKAHKTDLAAKITGMLLEMDNSELLLLLESPDSLAAKVDEAVQVLKLSKTLVGSQEAVHPGYLSAEVAVN